MVVHLSGCRMQALALILTTKFKSSRFRPRLVIKLGCNTHGSWAAANWDLCTMQKPLGAGSVQRGRKVCSPSIGFPKCRLAGYSTWRSPTSRRTMKTTSASSKRTSRTRIPSLPDPLRRGAGEILTAREARRIIAAHGGRPVTAVERRQLVSAGLWGLPKD